MVEKVFALGGSVIDENFEKLDELAESLEEKGQFVAVVGGGHLKKHQNAVRNHCTKAETDLVGIAATRFNARTLQALMYTASPKIPETLQEVKAAASSGRNVIMGGLNPGFSTDAVAAVVAELYDANLYFVTDVNGIYTEDPEENEDAEMLEEINVEELLEMTKGENEPGVYSIVDETAVQIIQRSDLKAKVFRGEIGKLGKPEETEGTDIIS